MKREDISHARCARVAEITEKNKYMIIYLEPSVFSASPCPAVVLTKAGV
jgi:hypothetical protein